MGRFVTVFFLIVATEMIAVNGISFSWLDPRGVGTSIEGRKLVLESGKPCGVRQCACRRSAT